MTEPRNPAENTGSGRFQHGNPGKPKGARSRATLAAEALLDGEAEGLTRKAVEMALGGDTVALRLCLERLVPPRKDTPLTFDMPPVRSAEETLEASASVLAAVAHGEITPDEGGRMMALLAAHRGIIETHDLEARLRILEEAHGK